MRNFVHILAYLTCLAISLSSQARTEPAKKQVEDANIKLKEKLDSLYIKNEELTKELKHLKKGQNKKKDLEKTREELNSKIDEMLAKLEDLNI